ncbi:hypothetical protein ACVWWN_007972 [Mycobacterium sp. URHB0021]
MDSSLPGVAAATTGAPIRPMIGVLTDIALR